MKETCCFPSNDHPHTHWEQPPSSAQSPATTHMIARTVDGERAGLGIAHMEETREHAREIQKKVKEGSKPHRPSSHLSRWIGQTHFLWTRSSSDVGTEGGRFLPERRNTAASVMFTVEGLEEDHSRVLHNIILQTATCPPNWSVPSRKEVEAREHGEVLKKKRILESPWPEV